MNLADFPGIGALRPFDIQQYLRNRGWTPISEPKNDVLRYRPPEDEKTHPDAILEVLLDSTYSDYDRRMAELCVILARLEGRSVTEIIDELSMPPGDIVQFRVCSDLVSSGTIPLDDAIRMRQAQRQLLLSAAHTVLEPRAHYSRLAKAPAVELLSKCREGQTARGSYLTRIWVPVEPTPGVLPFEEPLGRKTTTLLASGLAEVSQILSSGKIEALLDRTAKGLSANFLRALADLRPPGEHSFLDFELHWSRSLPAEATSLRRTRLHEGMFAALASASATLREQSANLGYEIEGYIALLTRAGEDPRQPGQVQIATTIDERPSPVVVRVELSPEDYGRALEAHRHAQRVKVVGTLRRENRVHILSQPTGFEVLAWSDGA